MLKRAFRKVLVFLFIVSGIPVAGCYFPPKYTDAEIARLREKKIALELAYQTRAGRQIAYYLFPALDPGRPPDRLVVAYPGIGSCALDWMRVLDHKPQSRTGFLLIDYPGYGANEGLMRPKYLYESSAGAIQALEEHFKAGCCTRISLLAHSFGCAAALQFSAKRPVEKVVLIAPFTSLREIAYKKTGPIAWLIPDRMDNCEFLKEIHNRNPRPEITIIHGDGDQVVPVAMARELFSLFPSWIDYHELPGAGHTDVVQKAEEIFFHILLTPATEVRGIAARPEDRDPRRAGPEQAPLFR